MAKFLGFPLMVIVNLTHKKFRCHGQVSRWYWNVLTRLLCLLWISWLAPLRLSSWSYSPGPRCPHQLRIQGLEPRKKLIGNKKYKQLLTRSLCSYWDDLILTDDAEWNPESASTSARSLKTGESRGSGFTDHFTWPTYVTKWCLCTESIFM